MINDDNDIDLQFGLTGIRISNSKNTNCSILENDITFNSYNGSHIGIYLENSPYIQTKCNDILGNSQAVGSGIAALTSPFTIMECNESDGMLYGIRFNNNNIDTDFTTNEMSNNKHGLFITQAPYLGDQRDKGNLWPTPPYGVRGATTTDNPSFPNNYQFYVTAPVTTAPIGTVNNMGFLPGCTTTSPPCYPECNRTFDCELTGDNDRIGVLTLLDSIIMADTLNIEQFPLFTEWSLRKSLLKKLENYPELIEGNEMVEEYLENSMNTSEWISAEIENKFKQFDFDQKDLYDIQSFWNYEIDSLKILTLLNDSIIFNPIDSTDSTQAITENILYRAQMDSLIVLSESINHELDSLRDLLHVNVMTLNNSIDPGSEFELYLKNINRLAIEKNINVEYEFTNSDSSLILEVSSLCPFEGGEAVFIARSLGIIYLSDTTLYEDDSLCVESAPRFAQNSNSQSVENQIKVNYKAIPNPFNSKVKITCDNCIIESFNILVYNPLGYLVNPQIVNNEIDLSNYSPGVYFVTLQNGNETVARIKIMKTP